MKTILFDDEGIKSILDNFGSPDEGKTCVLKRILDYEKNHLKCDFVVTEDNYICKDYRNEFSHLYSKVFEPFPAHTSRIHFFRYKSQDQIDISHSNPQDAEYLGYSVIRPIRIGKVGRTIIKPPEIDLEHIFCVCSQKYDAHINGRKYSISGCPFIQQDSMLMCCAHTSIWICARYMSQAFNFPEVLPFQISEATLKNSIGGTRRLPSEGLSQFEIFNSFLAIGYSPFMMNKPREQEYRTDTEYNEALKSWNPIKNIHRYIESGLPVLILVPEHTIVAIGHTLSNQRWRGPTKEKLFDTAYMIFSDEWVDNLIIHDDTNAPYMLFPRSQEDQQQLSDELKALLPSTKSRYHLADDDIVGYIVPLPEKVYITAEHLDTVLKGTLFDGPLAITLFSDVSNSAESGNEMAQRYISSIYDNNNPLVLRCYISESNKYKAAIASITPKGIAYSLAEKLLELNMPRFIWVIEMTTSDNFMKKQSERTILGQLIIDATGNKYAFPLIAAHVPGKLYIRDFKLKKMSEPIDIENDIYQPMFTRQQMLSLK